MPRIKNVRGPSPTLIAPLERLNPYSSWLKNKEKEDKSRYKKIYRVATLLPDVIPALSFAILWAGKLGGEREIRVKPLFCERWKWPRFCFVLLLFRPEAFLGFFRAVQCCPFINFYWYVSKKLKNFYGSVQIRWFCLLLIQFLFFGAKHRCCC